MTASIPSGKAKAAYVQERFSAIADRYDRFNDLITLGRHRAWKTCLVQMAELNASACALDICCGTGDIAQRLNRRAGPGGQVWGLDFASEMLRVARWRNRTTPIRFIQGDAMQLPFKSISLDAVTVGFGLRNLVDIDGCLAEVWRVLKPGGRFVSLDMGKVRVPLLKQLFHGYFFGVVPMIGKWMYPGERFFDYFPQSSLSYPAPESLAQQLLNSGFERVHFRTFYFGSTVIHRAFKPG